MDKREMYKSSAEEKRSLSMLRSAVERALSSSKVVIADSCNFIKGYRYELFCRAKTANTTHCVAYVDQSAEQCRDWNQGRYDTKVLEDLLARMETPNEHRRWDKPLFVLPSGIKDHYYIFKDIAEHLVGGKKLSASMSTAKAETIDSNYLIQLNSVTKGVMDEVLRAQSSMGALPGERVAITGSRSQVYLKRSMGAAEIGRIRRQFVNMCKVNPPKGSGSQVTEIFVDYLNSTF